MPNFLIETPVTDFQTLLLGETGVITTSGSVTVSGGNAVLLNLTGAGGTITLDNYGSIISPTAEAIALVGTSTAPAHVQIYNRAGATIGNHISAFTIGANFGGGTLRIDNAGTINGAIYTNLETDFITNSGTINGLISTDAGVDTITSSGTVNGGINAGSGNDIITLSGLAVVTGVIDGGTGIDRLTADYSAAAYHPDFLDRVITSSSGSFAGNFYSNASQSASWLRFQSIEQLALTFGSENDSVVVNLAALASGATISLDGGTGVNGLEADFSVLAGTTFTVAANGTITSSYGSFARFQSFDLTLGAGTNVVNTGDFAAILRTGADTYNLQTGASRDQIFSVGGAVTLNSGGDYDQWSADYSAAAANITASFNGATATLSNGSSATNLEDLFLRTGAGNDTLSTTGGVLRFYAGAGTDRLNVDYSGKPLLPPYATHNIALDVGGFFGAISYGSNSGDAGFAGMSGVEQLYAVLSDGDDQVALDFNSPIGSLTLKLDGGLGTNALSADLTFVTGATLAVAANGAITSNLGTIARFQRFDFLLGGGLNTITTGAGNDTYVSTVAPTGGPSAIDGGAGADRWTGTFQAAGAMAFAFGSNSASFTSAAGSINLANIETLIVTLGAGNDSGTVTAPAADKTDIDGGGGTDSLTIDYSARSNDGQFDYSQIASGIDGFIGYAIHDGQIASAFNSGDINALYFRSIEHLSVILGGDDDLVSVYGAASQGGRSLMIDGGGGRDTIDIPFSFNQFSVTPSATGGFAVTDIDLSNGNYGTLTVRYVELLSFNGDLLELIGGTAGPDTLVGTLERDLISGGAGDDILSGSTGSDTLYGDGGNDLLDGGEGNDTMIGGLGEDLYIVDDASDVVIESVDEGFDQVAASIDYMLGDNVESLKLIGTGDLTGTGNALDNVMRGNGGANVLFGGLGDDKLRGAGGDDTLFGEAGADKLFGGIGQDYLHGGEGADELTGGAGIDHFVFDSYDWDTAVDSILDFTSGTDQIDLDRSLFDAFAALGAGSISPSMFKLGTAATNGNHRLIYDSASGSLYYDPDGVGGAAQTLLAMLGAGTALSAGDLHLI